MNTRYCIDCRNYSKGTGIFRDQCLRPSEVNPVTGAPLVMFADTQRRFDFLCGKEGKYFEVRRVEDTKRVTFLSWLRGLR